MNPPSSKWRTQLYPATAMLSGLILAQIIATVHVYFSNRSLYHTLTAIHGAGYLTVPNQQTMGRLQELTTALCGGIFFTLSVGTGICLLSFSAAWLWDRVFFRKTVFLVLMLLLWAGLTAGVNLRGFSPFTSLYFFVIPPVVFAGTLKWVPHGNRKRPWRMGLLHVILIMILGLLWAPQMKKDLFHDIRDLLLVSNPPGERIVDFYYRYTLYPAEVLKSLDRKLLKTCTLNTIPDGPFKSELQKNLSAHDWIETENLEGVDLVLTGSGNELLLNDGNGTVLKIPKEDFLAHPTANLKRFSSTADRHVFFRQFTFYSLLMGFPVTLYIFFYSLVFLILGRWIKPGIASPASAGLCFSAGLLMLMPLWQNSGQEPARELRVSGSNETYEDIVNLLEDPSPSVVSAALSALGRRGEKRAVPKILRLIKASDHWYVQWYAYKALKALGWQQKKRGP